MRHRCLRGRLSQLPRVGLFVAALRRPAPLLRQGHAAAGRRGGQSKCGNRRRPAGQRQMRHRGLPPSLFHLHAVRLHLSAVERAAPALHQGHAAEADAGGDRSRPSPLRMPPMPRTRRPQPRPTRRRPRAISRLASVPSSRSRRAIAPISRRTGQGGFAPKARHRRSRHKRRSTRPSPRPMRPMPRPQPRRRNRPSKIRPSRIKRRRTRRNPIKQNQSAISRPASRLISPSRRKTALISRRTGREGFARSN